jgi:hypothetical protein
MSNAAPAWATAFIRRLCPPDSGHATSESARAIEAVQNLLDRSVRSIVITSGLIGWSRVRSLLCWRPALSAKKQVYRA